MENKNHEMDDKSINELEKLLKEQGLDKETLNVSPITSAKGFPETEEAKPKAEPTKEEPIRRLYDPEAAANIALAKVKDSKLKYKRYIPQRILLGILSGGMSEIAFELGCKSAEDGIRQYAKFPGAENNPLI